ncbi:hypothetical protein [Streptomyces ipomoeae]|uniref:hypothetical protein n=1 Tax=Streptomyces ipomoeae TaxID=103232 RepID=UPI0011478A56|nr:hypothetical protein [Streptomyces ipomoeae]TQE33028.1 hypothetical protein Sipo7851_21215 [Streptomyces ipomoeae]
MAISISAVVLLAIIVFLLIRSGRMGIGSALAAALLGFLLASSGAGPTIHSALDSLSNAIGRIDF